MNKYLRSATILLFSISMNVALCSHNSTMDSLRFFKTNFSESVELKEAHGSVFLTREQAQKNISNLLDRLQPSEAELIHEGFSEDRTSYYGIIQLQSDKGNHRLFYYCEKIEGEYLITKIRINKS